MAIRLLDTAELAEEAFYKAFEQGDLDAMMTVWAAGPDVLCVHPMGPALTGAAAIRASWQEIFRGQLPRRFEIQPISEVVSGDLVIRIVHETIVLPLHRQRLPTLIATNAYRQEAGAWRMVMHHASVIGGESPEMTPEPSPPVTRH